MRSHTIDRNIDVTKQSEPHTRLAFLLYFLLNMVEKR